MCFVLVIEEEVEQVERVKNLKKFQSSKPKREEMRVRVSHSEREPSGFKILRVRTPHSAGVLIRILNAYFCRRFVNKRLSQQAFYSKIRTPHSGGVLIN